MPSTCAVLTPQDHRGITYDVSEVDIVRCVVKSEGRKEVRVQVFFVLKKDPNVKGRKQKSFSISKFGLEGAWSRANRCKDFIEQLGRFPVDENEIEAFHGKSVESAAIQTRQGHETEKENRTPGDTWSPYVPISKSRRLCKDYNSTPGLLDSSEGFQSKNTSWLDIPRWQRRGKGAFSATTEITKLNVSNLPNLNQQRFSNAYFPCPPPHACTSLISDSLPNHVCLPDAPMQSTTSQSESRLLEHLDNQGFRHLLRFLNPPSLAAVESTSRVLARKVEASEGWKSAFFNCLPHMLKLAHSDELSGFPFSSATSMAYKGFFAYECCVRHWVLLNDIQKGQSRQQNCEVLQEKTLGCTLASSGRRNHGDDLLCDEEHCVNIIRKCMRCLRTLLRNAEVLCNQHEGAAKLDPRASQSDELHILHHFHEQVTRLFSDN